MGWFDKKDKPTDRWRREPEDLAIRIEAPDVKKERGNRPFHVYDGTVALIFQQGNLIGKLVSGKHDIDGRIRKWFVGDHPTTLIIADDGDCSLDVEVDNLHSRENIALSAKLRVTLDLHDPGSFYRNVMKDRKRYLRQDLLDHLRPELKDAVLAFTGTHPIADLYHNPALRDRLSDAIRDRVGQSLGRLGFNLVALNVVAFESPGFDALRGKQADTEIERLRAAVDKKAREILTADSKDEAVTDARVESAIKQAQHALNCRNILREEEVAHLTERVRQDLADFVQERTQPREKRDQAHQLEMDADARGHERGQDDLDWEQAKKVRDDSLDARRRMKMDDVELERERAKTLETADTATKIALGVGDKETLLELERLRQTEKLTPEQLLIRAAEKSDAAAAALAERFRSEGKLNEDMVDQLRRQLDQQRQSDREHSGQLERVLNQALEQMGKVAKAKADSQGPGDQTIVTGKGNPTVINPRRREAEDEEEPKP